MPEDGPDYRELQRRALLAGDDACQPKGVLKQRYGDGEEDDD